MDLISAGSRCAKPGYLVAMGDFQSVSIHATIATVILTIGTPANPCSSLPGFMACNAPSPSPLPPSAPVTSPRVWVPLSSCPLLLAPLQQLSWFLGPSSSPEQVLVIHSQYMQQQQQCDCTLCCHKAFANDLNIDHPPSHNDHVVLKHLSCPCTQQQPMPRRLIDCATACATARDHLLILSQYLNNAVQMMNLVLTILFTLEMLLKHVALGAAGILEQRLQCAGWHHCGC